jgi:hypothetical protein
MPEPAQEPSSLEELLAYIRIRIHETDVNMRDIFALTDQGVDFLDTAHRLSARDGMATAFREVEVLLENLIEQFKQQANG